MASYKIVLNLKGNALKRVAKLADELERAQKASAGLSRNLGFVGRRNIGGVSGHATSSIGRSSQIMTSLSSMSGLGSVIRFGGAFGKTLGLGLMGLQAVRKAVGFGLSANALIATGGARLVKAGADFLTSAQMSEGIRLLQRRQQARLGFGAQYAAAQERADLLAASYGLDPSNVIASMNVLTGMRVGNKKITMGQAERLTQVGGLIAQSSGLSFETVMVNIQQMMSQAVPSLRDIRQTLTHAPILGRYAIQDMEARGITGMSAMDYLKSDKSALMRVFERFLAENPAVAAMRAQGIVRQARTGIYANLAENPAWLTVAQTFKAITETAAPALNSLLDALTKSDAISYSISTFVSLLQQTPAILDKVNSTLDTWITRLQKFLGIEVGGTRIEEERQAVSSWVKANESGIRASFIQHGIKAPKGTGNLVNYILGSLPYDVGKYTQDITTPKTVKERHAFIDNTKGLRSAIPTALNLSSMVTSPSHFATGFYRYANKLPDFGNTLFTSSYKDRIGFRLAEGDIMTDLISKLSPNSTDNLNPLGGTSASGSDLSGYGRDRKALVINFQAPIVQWDSTINTDDPQDVVNEVANTLEQGVSRAIQIALLGATGKMSQSF